MQITFKSKHPWQMIKTEDYTLHVAGFCDAQNLLSTIENNDFETLKKQLRGEKLQFGFIIVTPDFVFAATDRTRSFPVFYDPEAQHVSNHAQALEQVPASEAFDKDSGLCFVMTGYVMGSSTLHTGIKQLQAGEYLFFSKDGTNTLERYYTYAPHPHSMDRGSALKQLDEIIDKTITDTLEHVGDKPLWVPLSGGYDSRIILAKFKEHGVENLQCFSYGVKNNDEALIARKVADTLDVPWHMLPAEPSKLRGIYTSQLRKDYEAFAHGYTGVPSYVEFAYIKKAQDTGLIPEGSFIINGQSGDFICGDHIPAILYETDSPTKKDMLDFIIGKHFSLWESLKTLKNIQRAEEVIEALFIPANPALNEKENLIAQYESFEWSERQSKMVVQSAQIYSFFGYNWLMPLWHADLMDFFETLPLELKYNRGLFVDYVKQYNYKGVFDIPKPQVRTWQPHQYWIIALAKFIELSRGLEAKQNFYKKMLYHGLQNDQLSLYGKELYYKHYKDIRNMLSLSVMDFFETHSMDFPR